MRGSILLIISVLLLLPGSVYADNAAWEWTTTTINFSNGSWVFGIDFTVGDSNITVDALGYYYDPETGLTDNHPVGMYDSIGNLLASATVTSADPLVGHFEYAAISPIVLLAGDTYRVVGVSLSDLYTWDPTGFATSPAITYLGDTYQSGTSLVDPAPEFHNDVEHGFFGPDFMISSTTPTIPEPSSVILLGTALGALCSWARRCSSRAR